MKDSNYTFENINKETITKNINFDKKTPQLNDIVYLPKEIVNEINIFQYGPIYDLNNLNTNEVIKVETKTEEYFLQRYYG